MSLRFETERLLIRDWQLPKDATAALQIYGNPNVTKFLRSIRPETASVCEYLSQKLDKYQLLNNGTGWWAITEKNTGEIVGSIILQLLPDHQGNPTSDYEIGWHLGYDHWGKGYATEAAQRVLEYGFQELNLSIIYAVAHPDNLASVRVTQRLGMLPMGRTNQYHSCELLLFQLEKVSHLSL